MQNASILLNFTGLNSPGGWGPTSGFLAAIQYDPTHADLDAVSSGIPPSSIRGIAHRLLVGLGYDPSTYVPSDPTITSISFIGRARARSDSSGFSNTELLVKSTINATDGTTLFPFFVVGPGTDAYSTTGLVQWLNPETGAAFTRAQLANGSLWGAYLSAPEIDVPADARVDISELYLRPAWTYGTDKMVCSPASGTPGTLVTISGKWRGDYSTEGVSSVTVTATLYTYSGGAFHAYTLSDVAFTGGMLTFTAPTVAGYLGNTAILVTLKSAVGTLDTLSTLGMYGLDPNTGAPTVASDAFVYAPARAPVVFSETATFGSDLSLGMTTSAVRQMNLSAAFGVVATAALEEGTGLPITVPGPPSDNPNASALAYWGLHRLDIKIRSEDRS